MKANFYATLSALCFGTGLFVLAGCITVSGFADLILRSPHLWLLVLDWEMPTAWVLVLAPMILSWAFDKAANRALQREKRIKNLIHITKA